MKKLFSLLLTAAMVCSLAVTAGAADVVPISASANGTAAPVAAPAPDLTGSTVILHTNDVHGAIAGYAKVAALKQYYQDCGAYVLLLDAGDYIQGDPTVSASQGATAIELMNLAGYDAAALGNHEFDYGYDNLVKLSKAAKFPILSANTLYNGKTAFGDNKIFTTPGGKKIGVFGLETPETATKAHPGKIKGVTFPAGEAMFKIAQNQVDALKSAGCDIIVCLGHLGIDSESVGNRSIDLLNAVKGIDLFIDGHSHSTRDEVKAATGGTAEVNGTPLTSTGTKLESIGVVFEGDAKEDNPMAYIAEEYFGIADITGAYIAGIVLCTMDDAPYVERRVDISNYIIFAPIFFASIGLKTDISGLTPEIFLFCVCFVIVALITKIIGCGLAAKICRFNWGDSLKIGVGMMTRGEVALIVAQKGLDVGVVDSVYFTAVILLIVVSSVATPLVLKALFTKMPPQKHPSQVNG